MLMDSAEYLAVLAQVKTEVGDTRREVIWAANARLVIGYWRVGSIINAHKVWGSKFTQNLSRDIRLAFPGVTGYSPRNLLYMAQLAAAYPDVDFAQRPAAQLPWRHNMALLDKVPDPAERDWYAAAALEHGWSRDIMLLQIKSKLYQRQVTATKTTNFETRLPPPTSDMAVQMLKDPYIFDFVETVGVLKERELENEMVAHVGRLLLELGAGFAFVGQQYHIEVEGHDFYADLLFYHLKLRCFMVVELKATDFKPEYAGQISFYVTAVDEMLRHETDGPTIGLLLCQGKTGLVADYALRGVEKPIGVSEYRLVRDLPADLAELLPSAADIASRISRG